MSLWAIWVVIFATLLLIGTDPSRPLMAVAATFAMVTVGALVASRRPANPIGWIFCALGLGFMVGGVSSEYATRALVDAPGSLPGGLAIGLAFLLGAVPYEHVGPLPTAALPERPPALSSLAPAS